jgi:hypothetical protein
MHSSPEWCDYVVQLMIIAFVKIGFGLEEVPICLAFVGLRTFVNLKALSPTLAWIISVWKRIKLKFTRVEVGDLLLAREV